MTITLKELLEEYFQKEDLQIALDEIGEAITGTNDELRNRILKSWFKKHRTLKQLLEMLPEDALEDICSDFGLSEDGGIDTLVRRILKNSVIQSPSGTGQPSSKVTDRFEPATISTDVNKMTSRPPLPHYGFTISKAAKKKSFWAVIVGASVVVGLVLSLVLLYDRFFPTPL